jgi:hypothetical protein
MEVKWSVPYIIVYFINLNTFTFVDNIIIRIFVL